MGIPEGLREFELHPEMGLGRSALADMIRLVPDQTGLLRRYELRVPGQSGPPRYINALAAVGIIGSNDAWVANFPEPTTERPVVIFAECS